MADNLNQFDSDTHRRVVANLSVPRSVTDLAQFLRRNDPYVDKAVYRDGALQRTLEILEGQGLVKNLGSFDTAKDAVEATKADPDVPTLHRDMAKVWQTRAERPDVSPWIDSGDHWYWTQKTVDKLNGPIPDQPPPKEG